MRRRPTSNPWRPRGNGKVYACFNGVGRCSAQGRSESVNCVGSAGFRKLTCSRTRALTHGQAQLPRTLASAGGGTPDLGRLNAAIQTVVTAQTERDEADVDCSQLTEESAACGRADWSCVQGCLFPSAKCR